MNPLRTLLRPPTVRAGLAAPVTIVLAALVAMVSCATVPLTGRHQLLLLSEGQEVQMGLDPYREVLKKSKLSTDPVATEQVRRVGRRIAEATGRTDYQWEFSLIEDKQVNAFCLPGGKVAVYTGLLPITGDDARLAAVLGHEVAHAIARHGGERVSQGLIVQVGLAATQVALARNDPTFVRQATALLGAGATVGLILPWSRAQESEADHLGLIFMAKAGYDPHAALDLWHRMAEAAKGRERPPEFLSTHPSEPTRIAQIEASIPECPRAIRRQPGRGAPGSVPERVPVRGVGARRRLAQRAIAVRRASASRRPPLDLARAGSRARRRGTHSASARQPAAGGAREGRDARRPGARVLRDLGPEAVRGVRARERRRAGW